MMATIMPVTVFAKRAMEDRTAKLLLEKVSFFHVAPAACGWCVHLHVLMCMCMYIWSGVCVFKSEHCNALDYYPFL